jgi:hypothetical protein
VLGVETFLRRSFTQFVSKAGAKRMAPIVDALGRAEGLVAHAEAAVARAGRLLPSPRRSRRADGAEGATARASRRPREEEAVASSGIRTGKEARRRA